MKYNCDLCNYSTDVKCNYDRHKKSSVHSISSLSSLSSSDNTASNDNKIINKKQFICNDCNNSYSSRQCLSRHKLCSCKAKPIDKDLVIEQLKEQQITLKEQQITLKEQLLDKDNKMKDMEIEYLKKENSELKSFIKSGKHGTKNYNISIGNYIQQHYTNAPPLVALNNYGKLIYEADEIENDDEFTSLLIYYYKRNKLHNYFGNFIVKHYKKENPNDQSLWNSDVSRLKYITRELLSNNKSIWNNDPNGHKTQKYIIDPLLNYVKEHIEKYKKNNIESLKILDKKTLERQQTYSIICKILNDIETGNLSNNIIKFIASHFKFNISEFVEYNPQVLSN